MIFMISYLLICFLQPVCLPIPETLTIYVGSKNLGSMMAVLVGVLGTVSGIMFMYWMTKKNNGKILSKVKKSNHLQQYQEYVQKHETLIIGLLFVIPVLPDEIISIGAGLAKVSRKKLLIIAAISKSVSISMIAYADWIAKTLYLNEYEVILCELILLFIAAWIMKVRQRGRMERRHEEKDCNVVS